MPTEPTPADPGHGPQSIAATAPAAPMKRRWLRQLGGDSLRGRYLYLAAGFALLLWRSRLSALS